ncbi:MAG: N-acetylneuraminate synthase family protein [Dehalococcoidia bacterium]
MSIVILDMGSGNTCRNDVDYAKRMIDEVIKIDGKKCPIIFKWQLEVDPKPPNKPLDKDVFKAAYEYASGKGYPTTSSVFDELSLQYLLNFPVPFIKLACNPDKYCLSKYVPRGVLIVASHDKYAEVAAGAVQWLACIPQYPATLAEYEMAFTGKELASGVSDHTPGLDLWNKYKPQVWEKHFVLERSDNNPDSGVFALTPDQLKEVIG